MKKEFFGAAIALVYMAYPAMTEARELTGRPVACAALEDAVYGAVLAASAGTVPVAAAAGIDARTGRGGLLLCRDTARTVSAGFTRAMAERNVYLKWQWPGKERGDLCLSADLSQCYPNQNPYVPFVRGDAAFAVTSWNAIVSAVGRTMPQGFRADAARFAPAGMAARLADEVRRQSGGRTQQRYYIR